MFCILAKKKLLVNFFLRSVFSKPIRSQLESRLNLSAGLTKLFTVVISSPVTSLSQHLSLPSVSNIGEQAQVVVPLFGLGPNLSRKY